MSVYMTEEEQIEAFKKWWKKYSTLITMIVSLVFLSIAGYQYWNWHQQKIQMQASNRYEHLMLALSNENLKEVQAYANQLIKEYDNTVYADVAHLTLARIAVQKHHYEDARNHLGVVAKKSHMNALQQIAKMRMARILTFEKKYDDALSIADSINDTIYSSLINELKGDIYAATGDKEKAAIAYQKAVSDVQNQGVGNLFLEMKMAEFASSITNFNKNEAVKAA